MSEYPRVFKYPVPITGRVVMPQGAEVLSVGVQDDEVFVGAIVQPQAPTESRYFVIAGTGHAILPEMLGRFLGTVMLRDGAIVLHVWEQKLDATS